MIAFDRSQPPRTEVVSASNPLHIGPALIVSAFITGSGAAPDGQIYDGLNSNGKMKADLRSAQNDGFAPHLGAGIFCETGIYVAVDASTTYLTISYWPGRFMPDPA